MIRSCRYPMKPMRTKLYKSVGAYLKQILRWVTPRERKVYMAATKPQRTAATAAPRTALLVKDQTLKRSVDKIALMAKQGDCKTGRTAESHYQHEQVCGRARCSANVHLASEDSVCSNDSEKVHHLVLSSVSQASAQTNFDFPCTMAVVHVSCAAELGQARLR